MSESNGITSPFTYTTHMWIPASLDTTFIQDDPDVIGIALTTVGSVIDYVPWENNLSEFSLLNVSINGTLGGDKEDAGNMAGTIAEWIRDVSLGLVLALLSLLTFLGNAMVLHAVRTEKRLQTVSSMPKLYHPS